MTRSKFFNPTFNVTELTNLYNACRLANPGPQAMLLEKAFCLLSWRFKRHSDDRHEQNPQWLTFGKLIGVGGYIDAAIMLMPEGYYKTVLGHPDGTVSAELTPIVKGWIEQSEDEHKASSEALAILMASLDIHIHTMLSQTSDPSRPSDPREYQIWASGWRNTEGRSGAQILGVGKGKTFKEAVISFADENPTFKSNFNEENMTHWGCTLHDNEADARKSFG